MEADNMLISTIQTATVTVVSIKDIQINLGATTATLDKIGVDKVENKQVLAICNRTLCDKIKQHHCCCCRNEKPVKLKESLHKQRHPTGILHESARAEHRLQQIYYETQQPYPQISKARYEETISCYDSARERALAENYTEFFGDNPPSTTMTIQRRQLVRQRCNNSSSVQYKMGACVSLASATDFCTLTTATGTTSTLSNLTARERTDKPITNILRSISPSSKPFSLGMLPVNSCKQRQQWQQQHTANTMSELRNSTHQYSHAFPPIVVSDSFSSHLCANKVKSSCLKNIPNLCGIKSIKIFSKIFGCTGRGSKSAKLHRTVFHYLLIILLTLSQIKWTHALLVMEPGFVDLSAISSDNGDTAGHSTDYLKSRNLITYSNISSNNRQIVKPINNVSNVGGGVISSASNITAAFGDIGSVASVSGGYLDKLDTLERSVAAVLIKVAYGTTSTTKRSIPDNSYVPSLTTIATPLLTTLRYLEKSSHQQQINLHHRNYELDLERDHALPTSAPNADILKSNSNPTYPNPNRHHNHERDRHRHIINSTPLPSLPNILKKTNGQSPTIPMYPGDIPSYSPPARSFFTPPLPPEYQNPFADKPTLRGTNNEGVIANTGTYINRRPIPPPSLMPGHERIPFRPPDLAASTGGNGSGQAWSAQQPVSSAAVNPVISSSVSAETERKKALNTPSRSNSSGGGGGVTKGQTSPNDNISFYETTIQQENTMSHGSNSAAASHNSRQEVLPSIRRILSGSNGNKGEIPEVLLKQATSRPIVNYHQPPSSPVVLLDGSSSSSTVKQNDGNEDSASTGSSNINKSKNMSDKEGLDTGEAKIYGKTKISAKPLEYSQNTVKGNSSSTPTTAAAIDGGGEKGVAASSSTTSTMSSVTVMKNVTQASGSSSIDGHFGDSDSSSSTTAAAAATNATWTVAWNIHVYFSVVLFTILAVYSLYKVLTYNKLTHLFSQSYFVCIHLILIIICTTRIFYLCYDAYNIHATFSIFVSEVLLNLPSTFLTISFSVLILFLFRKALNHKNNRYSALIRPLTVVVGCGVHVVLCITLHYVESYTLQNQQQQHFLYQQQQQQLLYRRYQHQQQQQFLHQHQLHHQQQPYAATANSLAHVGDGNSMYAALVQQSSPATTASIAASAPPPRVLSLICQIIYIFVCLFLGLLYLYLYRILKRILRSKSQNYIHGYQNLSYAIHITIATALLFVLLAALQIFGAISISTTRPLIQQLTAEIDWLQWGYQFSLRLIEIAIITLLSWVAGLKTSGGGVSGGMVGGGSSLGNGDARYVGAHGSSNVVFTGGSSSGREKHSHHHHHHNHSNVAGFFLPCTSSSSQEQFETDYPAVCNANTNLHTYTMRTGKLIYDDSFALNSLSGGGSGPSSQLVGVNAGPGGRNAGEFQLQPQPTYQRPYDTGSLHSSAAASHTIVDYGTQSTLTGGGNRYHHEAPQYADYLTDATTDHYENPNFDLHGSANGSGCGMPVTNSMQKFTAKTSTTSTTASSSGGSGSSAASQQQMLLLQSDSCYSEPLQPATHASSYDFNNFERPQLNGSGSGGGVSGQVLMDCWTEPLHVNQPSSRALDGHHSKREKKLHGHTTLDRSAYENPERRSSNSTHSCASSSGRYASYNSFDRTGPYNGVRKSGTLNNIVNNDISGACNGSVAGIGITHGRNSSASSAASSNVSTTMVASQRASGVQTLAHADRHHHQQQHHNNQRGVRSGANALRSGTVSSDVRENDHSIFGRSSLERASNYKLQAHHYHQEQQQNSDDDMMLSGSNVERTNLINNEDGSCITNSNSTASNSGNVSGQITDESNVTPCITTTERLLGKAPLKNNYNSSTHSSGNSYLHTNYQYNYPHTSFASHTEKKSQNQFTSNTDSTLPDSSTSAAGTSDNAGIPSAALERINVGNSGDANGEVLVSEHGFVRFRALDDINNAQGVGIHNASVRNSQGQIRQQNATSVIDSSIDT